MTPANMRLYALGKAIELQRLIEAVASAPEFGEGSCPANALSPLEDEGAGNSDEERS